MRTGILRPCGARKQLSAELLHPVTYILS